MNLVEKCERSETWRKLCEVVQECEFSSTPLYVVSDDQLVTLGTIIEIAYQLGYPVKKEALTRIVVNRMPIHIVSKQDKVPTKDVVYIEESS
jgi:hypothetical protein